MTTPPDNGDDDLALPVRKTPEQTTKWTALHRRRTALIVTAPIVSVATLMLGLRVGAGNVVRAATVFAAPPGKPASSGAPVPLAWQVLTYLEDRGVRETIGMRDLTVIARSKGRESRWTGASNPDGIAEASLAISALEVGDPISVEVLAAGESQPLASGSVEWQVPAASNDGRNHPHARPSKREGEIAIDVLVEGERLVVGFDTTVWAGVSVASGDRARVELEVTPEPGLRIDNTPTVGCDGFAEVHAVAESHVAGVEIRAHQPAGAKGVWFGALPVAPGAFYIGHPRFVPEGKAETAVLVAPNPRTVVYAEVDDERGRVFAAALPVAPEPGDPTPRARFVMPALAPGLHWIVVSGEPRGAEKLAGAAIAKPFWVGGIGEGPSGIAGVRTNEACSLGPWLARHPASGFPRWLALDGMSTRGASNRLRHRAGLVIGLLSLLIAAVLEILLLTAASREARAVMLLAELDDGESVTAKTPGGGLVIALLVAMLGFALLAAMLIAKG